MMKREDILGIRLSPPERELIEQRAKNDGRTASALVRHIVLTHLQPPRGTEHVPSDRRQDGALSVSSP